MIKSLILVISIFLINLKLTGQHISQVEESILNHFGQNIRYIDRDLVGYSVLRWTINNGEIIDEEVINPLSKEQEEELMRVLHLTDGQWDADSSTFTFYLPFKFKKDGHDFFTDNLPETIRGNALEEMLIVGYSSTKKFVDDADLVEKLNKYVQDGKFKKSLNITSELLRRNPFSQQIRDTHIYCLNKEERIAEACDNIRFIENFLNKESKHNCLN